MELRGTNALVTGAAGGLGRHISRALGAQGVNLVLSDLPGDALDGRAEEIAAVAPRVEVVPADLAKQKERRGLIAKAEEALGPIDVLVNNAGLEFVGPFTKAPLSEIDLITKVNLLSVMELTRITLDGMLERRRGHIVNIASLAGKVPGVYLHTYNATKHGVVGFTHALRFELEGTGVGATAICPGFIERDGMYGRVEADVAGQSEFQLPPNPLGTTPPEAVGAAVVKAVRKDCAEIIVNSRPGARVIVAIAALAPKAMIRAGNRLGVRETAREIARIQGRL
jgi:short-subunit dehydrogenase